MIKPSQKKVLDVVIDLGVTCIQSGLSIDQATAPRLLIYMLSAVVSLYNFDTLSKAESSNLISRGIYKHKKN